MPKGYSVAPPFANGPTQIMQNGEQFYIPDEVAAYLVVEGVIHYSPDDGPWARVYRPSGEWSITSIEQILMPGVGWRP